MWICPVPYRQYLLNSLHCYSSQTSSFPDIYKHLSNKGAVFWMYTEVCLEWWSDTECIYTADYTSRYINPRLYNSPWRALGILSTVILCSRGFCHWIPVCLRRVANSDFLKMIIHYWLLILCCLNARLNFLCLYNCFFLHKVVLSWADILCLTLAWDLGPI